MIRGYPAHASLAPGERLVLHISTDAVRFRVRFYRWGDGLLPVQQSPWLSGRLRPMLGAGDDWQWPPYEFSVPVDWPSAVYIAHLEEAGGGAPGLALTSAALLFVVRGSGCSGLLYKIPLATYHAYNHTGGGCFYMNPPRSPSPAGSKVSLRRPGGGIGGDTWGAPDHYDLSSARQTFAHWDARFIRWLLRNGYQPEFCTDLDIHADPAVLSRCRLLLSVGHDEYWSEATRDHVEDYVDGGGNIGFFSANLCWWRVHVVDQGRAIVCHQGGPDGALDQWWPRHGAGRPEDALGGVSYRHGGGWWNGERASGGYIVQQPEHWIFAGTGLRRGDAFGGNCRPPLAGYECDGVPLAAMDANGMATLSRQAGETGTPAGFQLLAASLLGDGWQERPARELHPADEGIHVAAMGMFSRNGTVFTAGSTDWAQVLDGGQERAVGIITRNVLDRLLGA